MPRRPKKQNKVLPKFLQPGVEKFEHWGRRLNEIFPDEPTSPPLSPHLTTRSLLQSEVQLNHFIEYQYLPSTPDDISGENLDELSSSEPYTGNSQSSSSSSSHHSSRQRSTRVTRNTSRSNTNDPLNRPPRRRESRRSRHETGISSDPSSSSTSPPSHLQSGPFIEPTSHDRFSPASSLQQSRLLIQRPASNLVVGNPTVSSSPRLDPFYSVDSAQVGPAVAEYPLSLNSEPQNLLSSSVYNQGYSNDANTSTYSRGFSTSSRDFPSSSRSPTPSFMPYGSHTHSAHASSSSLYAMTRYYHPNSSQSLNEAIMNDFADGRAFPSSYYSSLRNSLPPDQPPTSSMIPQICSDIPMNNTPGGTYATYPASNRGMSQMESLGLQTTSSSFRLAQTTGYDSSFEDDANVQDTLFPPGMNYRTLPRSHDYQEQSLGLSQREDYGSPQRTRHTVPGSNPTSTSTAHSYHPPNATASSSMSRSNHDQHYQGLRPSSSDPSGDVNWYRGRN